MPGSGEFQAIDIHKIKVNRESRQRKALNKDHIEALMQSLQTVGLLHPIIVDRELNLLAGECRLTAASQLGWKSIPAHFADQLNSTERKLIELEENVKRKNLEWYEEAAAVLEYCKLRETQNSLLTTEDLSIELSMGQSTLIRILRVAEELADDPKLKEMGGLGAADNFIQRKVSRALDGEFANFASIEAAISGKIEPTASTEPAVTHLFAPPTLASSFIRCADALEFFSTPQSIKYNLIHCDFPYGVGMDRSEQGKALEWGSYDDGLEVYQELLYSMLDGAENFMAQNAHLMFWFSMKHYTMTVQTFQEAGFTVNPFPLVWHKSDNRGILPDPQRGPRQIYETALLVTRGDRKIVRAVSNCFPYPMEKKLHQSQKNLTVLKHFLSMLVDPSTTFLDPTCGSGTAVRAALELNADVVLGLEKNPDYAKIATDYVNQSEVAR